jgi:hypothetical protein
MWLRFRRIATVILAVVFQPTVNDPECVLPRQRQLNQTVNFNLR